ncbi:archaellum component FlaC [Croceifilum oryzae]|uniref:Archaellum component FlaC n=1 Tax=Croceifilum oryzae TaxID=1553429 RepID=A0AAJ1THV0_9BACL|nr:hypothetical protein [Croceifilum oryzae]MDQ0418769.1 archaellum component FlaC [Croceifilum oryzae]
MILDKIEKELDILYGVRDVYRNNENELERIEKQISFLHSLTSSRTMTIWTLVECGYRYTFESKAGDIIAVRAKSINEASKKVERMLVGYGSVVIDTSGWDE